MSEKKPWTLLVLGGVLLLFIALTYVYLNPGGRAMLDGRTDIALGDGTDSAPMPYYYDLLLQTWKNHPSRLFYGSVYFESIDPEHGTPMWHPWNERWLVILSSKFIPLEQLTTAYLFWLFVLNGFFMFLLGRYLGWPWPISLGIGIAWAFNCFTRARAKVHLALAGIYHLPLIFLGLYLVARGRTARSLFAAMVAFLLAGMVAHYYLITSVFVSPLFVAFLIMQPEFAKSWKRVSLRMVAAVVPLVIFLGWNFFCPLPSDAKVTAAESTHAGFTEAEEYEMNRAFLNTFYTRFVDFFAGDIALQQNGTELNPARALVNSYVLENLGGSNPHERTNGIRWSIWVLAICGVIGLVRGRFESRQDLRRNISYFLWFGVFAAWLSFSPDFPIEGLGASKWLFSVFPKIRVACRSAIMLHFSLLMITGFFLQTVTKWRRFWVYPGAFALLMIIDYPPIQAMPMAEVAPAFSELQREKGDCGIGMAFPYFTPYFVQLPAYLFSQRMRGSDCPTLNLMFNKGRAQFMTQLFPPTDDYLKGLPQDPKATTLIEKFARCVPLNWIVFHQAVPAGWAADVCRRLGWTLYSDMSCIAPKRDNSIAKWPEQCL